MKVVYLRSLGQKLLPKDITAIALWPFIICRSRQIAEDDRVLNHERIHLKQQVELLVIPFYIVYLTEYLFLLTRYRDHNKAYRNISFEKEAYDHDDDLCYLLTRTRWAMWRMI